MAISVKFFASMRDSMGRSEDSINMDGGSMTAEDVWNKVSNGKPLPDSTLIAVNMEYTGSDQSVKDGDEVAFFPPVTGG